MPYEHYGCSICSKQAPKRLREHGTFQERMRWLRRHYMKSHPAKYREMVKKSVDTRLSKQSKKSRRR